MNKMNAGGWKPGTPVSSDNEGEYPTVTGNKALKLEERLIFELGTRDTCGVAVSYTHLTLPTKRIV